MATRHGEVLNRRECNTVDREYLLKFRQTGICIVQPRTSTLEGIRVTFLFVAYGDLGRGEVLVLHHLNPRLSTYTSGHAEHVRTRGRTQCTCRSFAHLVFPLDAFWAQASIAIDTKQLKRDTSSVHGSGAVILIFRPAR